MSSAERLVPIQLRATQKRVALLEAAAEIIAEKGYEGATLTDVAARARSSIGSLYRYFPDKPAVARALAELYGQEIAEHWNRLDAETATLGVADLVAAMLHLIISYLEKRPAFMVLVAASHDYQHKPSDRASLREHIAALVRRRRSDMREDEARLIASVTVEMVKGLSAMLGRHPGDKERIVNEFAILLEHYLMARL